MAEFIEILRAVFGVAGIFVSVLFFMVFAHVTYINSAQFDCVRFVVGVSFTILSLVAASGFMWMLPP